MDKEYCYDLIIVGGGPGGMAAAVRASELGVKKVLLIERDFTLGGILPQCIHNGFGLMTFKKELTGPEYSQLFINQLKTTKVEILLESIVLSISNNNTIYVANKLNGIQTFRFKSMVFALGCRERTRGAIAIPGDRPSGVYTAGFIQRMVNIEGFTPGENIVMLGSGDIGLIMARRLRLEGFNVKGVYELMPFSTGLRRNILQCLEDFNIPLFLSHTVTKISGKNRLESIEISQVTHDLKIIPDSNIKVDCDTLLLSVGLIPENDLLKEKFELDLNSGGPVVDENLELSREGFFACGNSLFVNDLVDHVTEDGYLAANSANEFLSGKNDHSEYFNIKAGENIAYIVPGKITGKKDVTFRIRAKIPLDNAYINFKELGFRKKEKFVRPGELIFAKLRKDYLNTKNLINNLITVDIFNEEQAANWKK